MQKAGFLTAFWALAKPYWVSEQRTKGLVLMLTVIGLSLGIVYLDVQFTNWNRDFFNALEKKDQPAFVYQLWVFTYLALMWIVAKVYRLYLQQMLLIEWRRWLNEHFLAKWLSDRAYYLMQLRHAGVDNPDQRIADDLRYFVEKSIDLAIGLLSAVVSLASFTVILWILSAGLTIGGVAIPGFMVWAAVIYVGIGSVLMHKIGRPLIALNFNQQRFEADYRYALVRLRENSEGVALYKGEQIELSNFRERFQHVIDNWWGIMKKRKQLNWFASFYFQFSVPFPYLVAAPRYFAGGVGMGFIFQVSSAFRNVHDSLFWFIDVYPLFAEWKATVDRLTTFNESLERARGEAAGVAGERAEAASAGLRIEGLEVALPQGTTLLNPTSLELTPGRDLLVSGPSGAGKSTLFRALAGIWPYWKGRVRVPKGARLLFLPQKPYLPIGALKRAVTYPADMESHSDAEVADALSAVGLPQLAGDLQRSDNWAQVLSGGEQQRMAFARALLNKPDWLFLDEATASLPEDAQDALYRLVKERLPNTTLVSIGHRSALRQHHDQQLAWQNGRLAAVT